MSEIIIKVENLRKLYHLGELHKQTNSFRDKVTSFFKRDGESKKSETIWALNDVSFEVKQGEVIGIIGRNGAGKSTLLKILSRITKPTSGNAWINGRVGSLLEVGTGFHQELTGRENIYLSAAILGMKKAEISKKFDTIVDFAEIEKFLDTPVKHYSSGMYVRLAFAVAAHLDPEILLVDEVLAVGDGAFQKKCLGKMDDVSKKGRTVLFVSHNMFAISKLCSTALLLENGEISFIGKAQKGIERYLSVANVQKGYANIEYETPNRQGPRAFSKLLNISTMNKNFEVTSNFKMGAKVIVQIEFEILKRIDDIELTFYFIGFNDAIYGVYSNIIEGYSISKIGRQTLNVEIPSLNLLPGNHSLGVWITKLGNPQDDMLAPALEIEIVSDDCFTGHPVDYTRYKHYGVLSRSHWKSV